MTPSIRSALLILSAASILAVSPAAQAGAWDEHYSFGLRNYEADSFFLPSSSYFLLGAGPSWLINAMPGAHARFQPQFFYDRNGDRLDWIYRYANDVGTLASPYQVSPFNVSLFSSALLLSGGSSFTKTTSPHQVDVTNITLFWDADGATTAATGGTGNWLGSNTWRQTNSTGTLQAWEDANRANFGGTAGTVTLNGAVSATGVTFSVGGYTISGANSLTVTSTSTGSGAQAFETSGTGTSTVSVPVILGGGAGSNQRFSVAGGTNLIIGGDISQTGVGTTISKSGAGTLTLNGNNSYSGGTTFVSGGGTIALGSNTALGSGTLTFVDGTALQSADSNARTLANVWVIASGTSNTIFGASGTGDLTMSDNTAGSLGGTVKTVTVNNTTTTLAKIFTGTAAGNGLTKAGTGTLALTSSSTYNGPTLVSDGTLKLSNTTGAAITTSSRITVNSGGTLQMGGNNQVTSSVPVTLGSGAGTPAKFDAGGFSQGTNATAGIGALTLASNSTLDLASNSLVHFAASTAAATGTLSILNWNGSLTTNAASGGLTTDLLRFGTANTDLSFLGNLQFVDPVINGVATPGTYAAMFASLNGGEVVPNPLAPIPEPSTWVGAALALGAITFTQRKRMRLKTLKS